MLATSSLDTGVDALRARCLKRTRVLDLMTAQVADSNQTSTDSIDRTDKHKRQKWQSSIKVRQQVLQESIF